MPDPFSAQHVVITGGDGALGRAVTDAFVAAGATCHLPVIGTPPPASPAGILATGPIDLTRQQQVDEYYAALPPIAASIHLAGGFLFKPIAETTTADLQQQLAINLLTAFHCCRAAVVAMRKSGEGRIVNVGARVVEHPAANLVAYTAAKAGVTALTRALAEEVRGDGILVNAVLPSIIDTPANRTAMPDAKFEQWPKPSDLARTIIWLASRENALTSGALIPVYGRS